MIGLGSDKKCIENMCSSTSATGNLTKCVLDQAESTKWTIWEPVDQSMSWDCHICFAYKPKTVRYVVMKPASRNLDFSKWPISGIPDLGWPISGIPDLRLALFRKLFRKLRFLGMFSTSRNQFLASSSSSISEHVYSAKKIAQKRSFLREVRA